MDAAFSEIRRVLKPGGVAYISEPVHAGAFNEILRLFHDERTVREAAFAAEQRAVSSGLLSLVTQRFYRQPLHFEDFAQFEAQELNVTHTRHRLSRGMVRQVRTRFDGQMTADGATFHLDHLDGYRGAAPVRIGNHAGSQVQLDVLGETLELSWLWHRRGHAPSDDYWEFLVDLVDRAGARWGDPDHGIWEMRGEPRHYVHSKVMCWSALNRGIALARELGRRAPVDRWRQARDRVREAVEKRGYDAQRGIFVQAFEHRYLDAALLRIPGVGFIDYRDERMLRTTDAIRAGLDREGLLMRYDSPDGLPGKEGAFLACSFWLAECLALQGRVDAAQAVFKCAAGTANDLGLFAEQYDPERRQLWSNFPQGLTHLSYITAALTLMTARTAGKTSGSTNVRPDLSS